MELATNESSVSVVHLIWLPYGIDLFKTFIHSYTKYPAGYPHKLIFLFNGVQDQAQTAGYEQYARDAGIVFKCCYKKEGQDIDAYFWIAQQLTSEYLLFFNSYSEILAAGWLRKYISAINESRNTGIVSATASYASPYDMILNKNTWLWETNKSFQHHFRKYKLLLKTIVLYRFYFDKFPNPHIRTNAFMLKRVVFLSLKKRTLKKKMDAYLFESGKNSMTNQLRKMNLELIVIDREGEKYADNQWSESHTFWMAEQENLLVADNQTHKYSIAAPDGRKEMRKMAWGID